MAEPFVPPDTGSAQAWARQIEISPRTAVTLTVDEGTLEPLIASASEAGLTTMMLFLTRARGFAPCSRIWLEGDAGPRIQDALPNRTD